MASELRVDRILPVDGASTGGGGGIVQVVTGVLSTHYTATGAAGDNYWVYPGLAATITPKKATNNILIQVSMYIGHDSNGYQQEYQVMVNDGSGNQAISGIIGTGGPYGVTGRINMYSADADGYTQYRMATLGGQHMHKNIQSTNALTYKVRLKGYSSQATVYVNRSRATQSSGTNYDGCPQSTITLMEVCA